MNGIVDFGMTLTLTYREHKPYMNAFGVQTVYSFPIRDI